MRVHAETLSRWKYDHRGRSTISGGIEGTAFQETWPRHARKKFVNVFTRSAPPRPRINSRA